MPTLTPGSVHTYDEVENYRFLKKTSPENFRPSNTYAGVDPVTGDFVPFKFLGFTVIRMESKATPEPIPSATALFQKYNLSSFSSFDTLSSKEDGQVLLTVWANIPGTSTATTLFFHANGQWRFGAQKREVEFWKVQEVL